MLLQRALLMQSTVQKQVGMNGFVVWLGVTLQCFSECSDRSQCAGALPGAVVWLWFLPVVKPARSNSTREQLCHCVSTDQTVTERKQRERALKLLSEVHTKLYMPCAGHLIYLYSKCQAAKSCRRTDGGLPSLRYLLAVIRTRYLAEKCQFILECSSWDQNAMVWSWFNFDVFGRYYI